jgi:hypothetical protein
MVRASSLLNSIPVVSTKMLPKPPTNPFLPTILVDAVPCRSPTRTDYGWERLASDSGELHGFGLTRMVWTLSLLNPIPVVSTKMLPKPPTNPFLPTILLDAVPCRSPTRTDYGWERPASDSGELHGFGLTRMVWTLSLLNPIPVVSTKMLPKPSTNPRLSPIHADKAPQGKAVEEHFSIFLFRHFSGCKYRD